MTSPEAPRQEEDPRVRADNFCEEVRHAAELTDLANKLRLTAQRAASKVSQESILDGLPFMLEVTVPEGVQAHIASDGDVIEEHPTTFLANEIGNIGVHGVEFYNRRTDQILRIDGYDFEISPVFPEDPQLQIGE